ncbi:hypothetical protein [Streptomyces sp. NPDC093544]|uniref:hypothetical protein n=1 Tax=Streptomyces sp. NPDC093544 TaxID=3155200 RepID=UPI0034314CE4
MAAMEDVTAPWTMILDVRWRPTPRVYDGRTRLLLLLESQKRLRAFKIDDEIVRAVVGKDVEILLSPTHISIADSTGSGDSEAFNAVLDAAKEAVDFRATSVSASFQHLVPFALRGDYEESRISAAKGLFGRSLVDGFTVTDTATLVDGKTEESGSLFKAEFGIVDREEALERLSKKFGRLRSSEQPDFSHVKFDEREISDAALYVDSTWHRHSKIPQNAGSEWFVNLGREYSQEAGRLVSGVFRRVSVTG